MFKRFSSSSFLLVAMPLIKTDTAGKVKESGTSQFVCKPSELPLYEPLMSSNRFHEESNQSESSTIRRTIENCVSVVRSEVQSGWHVVSEQKKHLDTYLDKANSHSQSAIDYLNQPHNVLPRSGAIAIGGLSGFIFAIRGGFIKKVLYTTIGAGAIASLCYPRQAEQFGREALYEARKGYAIAYNFVKGVKPGDNADVEPINNFPTSIEDVKLLLWDLYDEAKEALVGKKE